MKKLSEHQNQLLKRLRREPLIARKTIKTDEGRYLGLRSWKFEQGDKKTVLNSTVVAMCRTGLVEKIEFGNRFELRIVRK
jgi:hypothetical protein